MPDLVELKVDSLTLIHCARLVLALVYRHSMLKSPVVPPTMGINPETPTTATRTAHLILPIDLTADRADLPARITAKVIDHMNLPTDADVARFNQMCNSGALTLRWLTYNPETYSRLNKLTYIVDNAATANTNILRIRINVNGLHYKDNFKSP